MVISRCFDPMQPARNIYDALKHKHAPFVRKQSVVHKSELDNCQFI
jgi:hypothetical protein